MSTAVFPGTFDPITHGHLDVIRRAARVFDRIIVAVGTNPAKNVLFTIDERLALAEEAVAGLDNVDVMPFEGLLVDFLRANGATIVVRGLRTAADFDYERAMAYTNGAVLPEMETVFLASSPERCGLNARLIKEIAVRADDLSAFVPDHVARALRAKLRAPGRIA